MADLPPEEAAWLREMIASQEWIYARTYAKSYPHEYFVRGKGNNPRDYYRFRDLISTYGHIQLFYRDARAYLILDGWKYWWIDPVLNRAQPPEKVYGEQWASDTRRPGKPTPWDLLAARWDERTPNWVTDAELAEGHELLHHISDGSVLNVGCATGRMFKVANPPPSQYLGIDPSQAMLNQHVIKHKRYRVLPMTMAEYADSPQAKSFDTVIAVFGSADYLSPKEIEAANELADDLLVLMFHGSVKPEVSVKQAALMAAMELPGAEQSLLGRWEVVTRSARLL